MKNNINFKSLEFEIDRSEVLSILEYDDNDIIFISGSIVEGISNKYSDLDVYVIEEEFSNINLNKMDYISEKHKTQFGQLSNGIGCDIEYWPLNTVVELVHQIKNINFEDLSIRTLNQLSIKNYSIDELASFIHRFENSYPIYNQEKFNVLKEQLQLYKFCKLMARRHINNMDNIYEDVIGNLESNSKETALISSRNLLFKLMNAYIFSEKHTIDREKWVFEKLNIIAERNITAKGILDEFRKLYCYSQLNNEEDIIKNIENILNFSNRVLKVIEKNLGGI